MPQESSKSNIIKITQDFWEPRLGYRPTEGQAETMIRNVTNLFKLLIEWETQDVESSDSPGSSGSSGSSPLLSSYREIGEAENSTRNSSDLLYLFTNNPVAQLPETALSSTLEHREESSCDKHEEEPSCIKHKEKLSCSNHRAESSNNNHKEEPSNNNHREKLSCNNSHKGDDCHA